MVVGAGMAGLACARRLQSAGWAVTVADKGRRPGGRVATRDTDVGCFDHGAQFFTRRNAAFIAAVDAAAPAAAAWQVPGRDAPVWTGWPTLRAFAQALADGLDLRCAHAVERITRSENGWQVKGRTVSGQPFEWTPDYLVLTVPLPQLAALCPWQAWPDAGYAPSWTVMLGLEAPITPVAVPAAHPVLGSVLSETDRPGRSGVPRITVQANAAWSRRHLEDPEAAVVTALRRAAAEHLQCSLESLTVVSAHRWRYALCERPAAGPYWDADQKLGAAGDGWSAARVESAWCSGHELAGLMLGAR